MVNQQIKRERQSNNRMRLVLLVLSIFLGAGALFGATMAFVAPDFMGSPLLVPVLQEIPIVGSYISSLIIPAAALLLCIAAPHLIAVILLLRKHPQQYISAIICGILVVVFTAVEMIFIPNPASVLFLFFGISEIVLASLCAKS